MSWLIGAALICVLALAVSAMWKDKKAGGCAGGCAGCSGRSGCQSEQKTEHQE